VRWYGHGAADRGAGVTVLLAAVWLLLDYPWGLLAFVAIAALFGGISSAQDQPQ